MPYLGMDHLGKQLIILIRVTSLLVVDSSSLTKTPQVENVSPPAQAKTQQTANPPSQPSSNPTTSVIANPPVQSLYYQQGYKFMGIQSKDASHPVAPELPTQHISMGQQMLHPGPMVQNAQAVGGMFPHGMPMHTQAVPPTHGMIPAQPVPPPHGQVMPPSHGQVMPPHEQIPVALDQGQYAYSMGPQQHPQPQQQQQHLRTFAPTQMPPVSQWQAQQPGLGPGWMK